METEKETEKEWLPNLDPEPQEPCCRICKAYRKPEYLKGQCRRHSPNVGPWSEVEPDGWCYEFV